MRYLVLCLSLCALASTATAGARSRTPFTVYGGRSCPIGSQLLYWGSVIYMDTDRVAPVADGLCWLVVPDPPPAPDFLEPHRFTVIGPCAVCR